MDISKKLISDLTPKNSLTGTFFNEKWMQDNAIDVARARQLTEEANHKLCFNPSCHICNDRERKERTEKQSADIKRDERRIEGMFY